MFHFSHFQFSLGFKRFISSIFNFHQASNRSFQPFSFFVGAFPPRFRDFPIAKLLKNRIRCIIRMRFYEYLIGNGGIWAVKCKPMGMKCPEGTTDHRQAVERSGTPANDASLCKNPDGVADHLSPRRGCRPHQRNKQGLHPCLWSLRPVGASTASCPRYTY